MLLVECWQFQELTLPCTRIVLSCPQAPTSTSSAMWATCWSRGSLARPGCSGFRLWKFCMPPSCKLPCPWLIVGRYPTCNLHPACPGHHPDVCLRHRGPGGIWRPPLRVLPGLHGDVAEMELGRSEVDRAMVQGATAGRLLRGWLDEGRRNLPLGGLCAYCGSRTHSVCASCGIHQCEACPIRCCQGSTLGGAALSHGVSL